MILIHVRGSHWRIREPFSGYRMLIASPWRINVISAAPSHLPVEADTPSLLGASRVPSAIIVTFILWSGVFMSVCEHPVM
jgi:hypothetical protein